MHHHSRNIAPYPPPDVVQRHDSASDPTPSTSSAHPQEPSTTAQPSFLIINLFALRLTLRLISRIPAYPSLNQDMFWLTMFLSPFPATHDLAKLTSRLKHDYLATYPKIVGRMKRQPKYPAVFMQMNPATWERREEVRRRGWTDGMYCDTFGRMGADARCRGEVGDD